jgi:hypothetical protein
VPEYGVGLGATQSTAGGEIGVPGTKNEFSVRIKKSKRPLSSIHRTDSKANLDEKVVTIKEEKDEETNMNIEQDMDKENNMTANDSVNTINEKL